VEIQLEIEPIRWVNRELTIIDQTLLPGTLQYIELKTLDDVCEAIKKLRVRGAPAIGICAAYGILVYLSQRSPANLPDARTHIQHAGDTLIETRPTAVNLAWAINRMRTTAESSTAGDVPELLQLLEQEASAILQEDIKLCHAIGKHGEALIKEGDGVLTHCNAGGLATSGYGTALAVLFTAHEKGRKFQAFVDETRPLLQGARLTAWELMQAEIDTTLICDNAAAHTMATGKIHKVIVGADRIAANGDTANKIGTYNVALLAHAHNIPFYVAAPYSTFDGSLKDGTQIPIEFRDATEVTQGFGPTTAPQDVKVRSPAFDVTPEKLISGIITEQGVLSPPYGQSIAKLLRTASEES
jgi:methylthioribose-1-phosphate isomerase